MITPINDTTVTILYSLYSIPVITAFIVYGIETGLELFKKNAQ